MTEPDDVLERLRAFNLHVNDQGKATVVNRTVGEWKPGPGSGAGGVLAMARRPRSPGGPIDAELCQARIRRGRHARR